MLAAVAQLVERVLGKDEVMGPNPISSSDDCWPGLFRQKVWLSFGADWYVFDVVACGHGSVNKKAMKRK